MSKLETLLYEEKDGVAWVTLNRPDTFNAFNAKMQQELRDLWRGLRYLYRHNVLFTAAEAVPGDYYRRAIEGWRGKSRSVFSVQVNDSAC